MMELAVMVQSVNVMQEAVAEVDGVVNGPAGDEVRYMYMYGTTCILYENCLTLVVFLHDGYPIY